MTIEPISADLLPVLGLLPTQTILKQISIIAVPEPLDEEVV
jgi:hypothetical protein